MRAPPPRQGPLIIAANHVDILEIFLALVYIQRPTEVLGADETKVGRVRITAVKGARLSTATTISGSGFRAGDTLKN